MLVRVQAMSCGLVLLQRMFGLKGARKVQKLSLEGHTFQDVWQVLIDKLDQELQEATMISRKIWTRRNNFVHNKGF